MASTEDLWQSRHSRCAQRASLVARLDREQLTGTSAAKPVPALVLR